MPTDLLLVTWCLLITVASWIGGSIPSWVRLSHQRMQIVISGIAGFMLGVGLLHMLPHAVTEIGSVSTVMPVVLAGFLAMFFIERFMPFHHHDLREPEPGTTPTGSEHPEPAETDFPPCVGHAHDHPGPHAHGHRLTWSGAAMGLTLHSLLDGIALAAAVQAGSTGAAPLAGLAVFLVIFAHRPFDSLTLMTLMASNGWSKRGRLLVNVLFALMVPLGALLFVMGLGGFMEGQHLFIGYALAFAAGTFLCIASSDLLPELQFHQHDRLRLSGALLMGLALAWGVGRLDVHADGDHAHGETEHEAP